MWWDKKIGKEDNTLLKKIVLKKPLILNMFSKISKSQDFERISYYKGQIDLMEELLDGKG